MDQGTGDCTQGQSTPVTDTMDQGTGDCTQGQSSPVTDQFVVKLIPPWSIKKEPQDEPSAVYNTVQPMTDNTAESPLSLNTSHVCQRCSAVFTLSGSLEVHMETFHGETMHSALPVASAGGNTDKMPRGQEGYSTYDSTEKSVTSSPDFVIKLETPWSMKEGENQPMSDNTAGSPLSLNTGHACQRCSATFVLFSTLELHMVTFHGETLHDLFPMYCAYSCSGVGSCRGKNTENVGNHSNQKAVKRRKKKVEDKDADRTDQEKKNRKHVCDVCSKYCSCEV
ncbi:hypothetical protein ACOMHN_020787 [Nucella lapillus]